jgi:sarcosine oxidase
MTQSSDVVVVGAGVMGTATAWQLARAGRHVTILERFDVGHSRGSSHGRARVFRFAYEDPAFVRMAIEAKPLWRELEDAVGEPGILTTTGGLDVGPDLSPLRAALEQCEAPFESMSREEAGRRFSWARFRAGEEVVYHPDAGVIAADRAVSAFLRAAVESGARLLERAPALELAIHDDGASIRTPAETLHASVAVVTAGSWAKELLGRAGIDLDVTPTRETVAFFPVRDGTGLATFIEWSDRERPFYALPSPGQGVKAGAHHAGMEADPNEVGVVSEAIVGRVSRWVAERLPSVDPNPHHAETCLYTNTSDERFVLERRGPVVVGSACSGHGFKFAPLIGKRLAELALAGRPAVTP